MSILIECKDKYIVGRIGQKGSYRTRTGPQCCSINCPSTRKKQARKAKGTLSATRLAMMRGGKK